MRSEKELIKIALAECVQMIGEELVYAHKELCCDCWRLDNDSDGDGLFHYWLGLDTYERPLVLGEESVMEYYAVVTVDPETGEVTRDYERSVLP